MITIDATNLPRFMACNGSYRMASVMPPVPSDTTTRDEGNAAHWLASVVFTKQFELIDLIDRKAPNGVYITPEIAEHVEDYLISVGTWGEMECETSFQGNNWRVNARADHISYDAYTSTLNVNDFKYGWSIVEPQDNWTLIAHAIGFCIRLGIAPQTIIFTIHQPRPLHSDGPVRSHTISHVELMQLYAQLDATLTSPSDMLDTGPHCRKCHALPSCPAARKARMNAIDVSEQAHDANVSDILLAFELDTLRNAAATIKTGLEALEELAMHRLRQGAIIENYAVESKLTNRDWKPGIDVAMLQVLTGKDLSKPKPVTPAQAERMGVSPEVVAALTERRATGMKLVRIDANRRAEKLLGKK